MIPWARFADECAAFFGFPRPSLRKVCPHPDHRITPVTGFFYARSQCADCGKYSREDFDPMNPSVHQFIKERHER